MPQLHYEVVGDGPAVTLIHEGIGDSRMWDDQVPEFVDAGYRVLRYDLRGYGRSPLPGGPYSQLEDLEWLLGQTGIERTALVGASYGGRIALEFALEHPDAVWALVLVAAGLRDAEWSEAIQEFGAREEELIEAGKIDEAVELNVRTWVDGPSRRPEEVDAAVRERVREMQRHAFDVDLAAYARSPEPGPEAPLDPPASARLADIRCPTLVVLGDLDQPDILRIGDQLATGIAGARKHVIEGAAHALFMEKPDGFNRVVLDFLRDADRN